MKCSRFLLSLAIVLLTVALIYCGIWYQRFSQLATQYVEHHYDFNTQKIRYSLVPSPPDYWVPLQKLDPLAYGAITISEDWNFYHHPGIDTKQIKKAIWAFAEGQRLRGASTITQQLIKNIYLDQQRSWLRKAKEALLALAIEKVLGKQRILEVYLNIIEYGEGVYGITKASLFYFQKSPENLTVREGAFLAILLPSPKKYSQSFRNQELSEFASQSINEVLKKMKVAGQLSDQEFISATKNIFSWENRSFITDDPQYFDLNQ